MVEKAHTAAGRDSDWWPSLYAPFVGMGRRIADFFSPEADAASTKEAYEITIELPGVQADAIDVSVADGTLTVKGEKRSERKDEGRTYYFAERTFGAFQRTFRLPADAQSDEIAADFKDGVLKLSIPKRGTPEETSKRIPVQAT